MTAPDDGEPRRQRLVIRFWLLVFPVLVLAVLLGAIAAGIAPDRLRPIAIYWGVTTAMSISPDHSWMVVVYFTEPRAIVATATPASARVRSRVGRFLGSDLERAEGQIMLMPGTGNLPGAVLVAALEEAVSGQRPHGLN